MTLDLNRLRELAQAATPGPWEARGESPNMGGENFTLRVEGQPGIRMSAYVYGFGTGIQEFIAAANPTAVLALIERAEKAEASIAAAVALHHIDPHAAWRTFKRCVCEEIWPCSTRRALSDETSKGENDAVAQKD